MEMHTLLIAWLPCEHFRNFKKIASSMLKAASHKLWFHFLSMYHGGDSCVKEMVKTESLNHSTMTLMALVIEQVERF